MGIAKINNLIKNLYIIEELLDLLNQSIKSGAPEEFYQKFNGVIIMIIAELEPYINEIDIIVKEPKYIKCLKRNVIQYKINEQIFLTYVKTWKSNHLHQYDDLIISDDLVKKLFIIDELLELMGLVFKAGATEGYYQQFNGIIILIMSNLEPYFELIKKIIKEPDFIACINDGISDYKKNKKDLDELVYSWANKSIFHI